MYEPWCRTTAVRHDPCVPDVFIAIVKYMNGAPPRPWWKYTPLRKQTPALRNNQRFQNLRSMGGSPMP
jgi:hypothetical protein